VRFLAALSSRLCFGVAALAISPSVASAAGPRADTDWASPAPSRALEIGFAVGYTQPFGELPADIRRYGLIGAGGAFAVELGYRVDPHWSVSSWSQVHESLGNAAPSGSLGVLGLATAAQCTHRFSPFESTSPLLTFGVGYRALWLLPSGADSVSFHGLELGKVSAGFDLFKPNAMMSFGALIGFDLTLLMFEDAGRGLRLLDDPRPVSFVFAAVAVSFDVGGERVLRKNL
jgi:hypothetical protein